MNTFFSKGIQQEGFPLDYPMNGILDDHIFCNNKWFGRVRPPEEISEINEEYYMVFVRIEEKTAE
jgi:hypothetical protein